MTRIVKGSKGYIQKKRIQVLIRTIIYFGIAAALYITGYVTTKTNKNLLTIVAVLGCLPASKSLVNTIMFYKAKGCSKVAAEWIEAAEGRLVGMYDLYFTSYKKNFDVSHMVVDGKNICGYTEDQGCDTRALELHLAEQLKLAGIKDETIKIFKDEAKYKERLRSLNAMERDKGFGRDDEIRVILYEISL